MALTLHRIRDTQLKLRGIAMSGMNSEARFSL
jgi:hypothetical protein